MRNPKWHRDEIILALELYFKLNPGQIHSSNPLVIELSALLNKLPIFENKPDIQKFRNPNGVTLKLSNFLAIDPNYTGKGMNSFSKQDQEVFYEFKDEKDKLNNIASKIRAVLTDRITTNKIYQISDDEENDSFEVKEGKVLYKLHKVRERNQKIIEKKKQQAIKKFSKLECEVCAFDFHAFYGNLGKGFIECHHIIPLSDINYEQQTKLEDLILVCSNCHNMIHRGINNISIKEIKEIVNKRL